MPGKRIAKRRYKKKQPVRKVVKDVLKSMTETKYYTTDNSFSINNADVSAGGDPTFQEIFQPVQGTAYNERIGDEVFVKNIWFRASIYSSLTVRSLVRVFIVRYKDKNDTSALKLGSLLETAFEGTASYPLSFYSLNSGNRQRFEVLYDKTFKLTSGSNTSAFIDHKIRLDKKWVRDPVSSQETGGLAMIAISDVPSTGSMPSIAYNVLVSYTDM